MRDIPTSFQLGSLSPVAAFLTSAISRRRSLSSRFQGRPRLFRTTAAKSWRSFGLRFSFTRSRELNQRDLPTSQATAHGTLRPRVQSLPRKDMPSCSGPLSHFLLRPSPAFDLQTRTPRRLGGAVSDPGSPAASDSCRWRPAHQHLSWVPCPSPVIQVAFAPAAVDDFALAARDRAGPPLFSTLLSVTHRVKTPFSHPEWILSHLYPYCQPAVGAAQGDGILWRSPGPAQVGSWSRLDPTVWTRPRLYGGGCTGHFDFRLSLAERRALVS